MPSWPPEAEAIGSTADRSKELSLFCSPICLDSFILRIAESGTIIVELSEKLAIDPIIAKKNSPINNRAIKEPVNAASVFFKNCFISFINYFGQGNDIIYLCKDHSVKMKKLFIYISATALIFTYVFSNVGFVVHECLDSGSIDVVSLLGDVSCEDIHEYSHEMEDEQHSSCSENCGGGTHGDNCCDSEVFNLSLEQDVRASLELKKSQFPETLFLFPRSEEKPLNEACSLNLNHYSARDFHSYQSGREKLTKISTWIL